MNRIVAVLASVLSLAACGLGPGEDLNNPESLNAAEQDLNSSAANGAVTRRPSTVSKVPICRVHRTEAACDADARCEWVEVDDGVPPGPGSSTGGGVIIGGICIADVQSSTGGDGSVSRPTTSNRVPSTVSLRGNICSRLRTQQLCELDDLCKWLEVDATNAPSASSAGANPDHIIVGGLCVLAVQQDPPPPGNGSAAP